jgi:hypothetical protein
MFHVRFQGLESFETTFGVVSGPQPVQYYNMCDALTEKPL